MVQSTAYEQTAFKVYKQIYERRSGTVGRRNKQIWKLKRDWALSAKFKEFGGSNSDNENVREFTTKRAEKNFERRT